MAETLDSVTRALDVLRLLEHGDTLTLSQITRELNLSLPRAHRILATLERSGFIFRSPEDKSYRLTFGTHGPDAHLTFDLVLDVAHPILEKLRDDSEETAHLAMLSGRHVYFSASVESPQVMRVTSRVGRRVPALLTAAGKVLLAYRPDDQLDRMLAAETRTTTDAARLRKELKEARRTGMARNLGESEVGMATLAVPIRTGADAPTHALAISGPESRINPNRAASLTAVERRHLQLLTRAAAQVSAALVG